MEFFNFFRWVLVIAVSVTLYWPLTVPLAALAYKVRLGPDPIPMPAAAFWTRSTFAALGMAILALVLCGLAAFLVRGAELPAAMVLLTLFMGYVPVAVWLLAVLFAYEDLLEGLSVLVIWIFLPGLLLGALDLMGLTAPLALADSWLPKLEP
ncbi:MAG: hypothetical protein IT429_15285 [Gemmataceae bacterium]|nr:hypothetical protein [Gemmataceae bacterium]